MSQHMNLVMIAVAVLVIAGAAQQQATGIHQIKEAMTSVEQGGQDTAGAAKQIAQAVSELDVVGKEIRRFVEGAAAERARTAA